MSRPPDFVLSGHPPGNGQGQTDTDHLRALRNRLRPFLRLARAICGRHNGVEAFLLAPELLNSDSCDFSDTRQCLLLQVRISVLNDALKTMCAGTTNTIVVNFVTSFKPPAFVSVPLTRARFLCVCASTCIQVQRREEGQEAGADPPGEQGGHQVPAGHAAPR